MNSLVRARAAMICATVIWGATFVVVHDALNDLPVFHLLTFRFLLGALVLAPLLLRQRRTDTRPLPIRTWLSVGVAIFAGYSLQTYGLIWTTPARSAFVTGLAVVFVPVIAWLVRREPIRPSVLIGATTAVLGLFALFRPGLGGSSINLGDLLTLGCAVAFACHVLLVERSVRQGSVLRLAIYQFLVVGVLSSPSLLIHPPSSREFTRGAILAIAVTGLLATAVAFLCQLYAQRHLSATETILVLALEPVVAAIYSVAVGAETWSPAIVVGGGLVVLGMTLVQLDPFGRHTPAGFSPPRS